MAKEDGMAALFRYSSFFSLAVFHSFGLKLKCNRIHFCRHNKFSRNNLTRLGVNGLQTMDSYENGIILVCSIDFNVKMCYYLLYYRFICAKIQLNGNWSAFAFLWMMMKNDKTRRAKIGFVPCSAISVLLFAPTDALAMGLQIVFIPF